MKQTRLIMGMPITVEIKDLDDITPFLRVFDYFEEVDERFSPYKPESELSKVNSGLGKSKYSRQMRQVLDQCEQTKRITQGYFDIEKANGKIDPSGLVKGWAIENAASLLGEMGYSDFYIEAGGDIRAEGPSSWSVGIRNPFDIDEVVKIVQVSNKGIATSGTYVRGDHIYDPLNNHAKPTMVASLTVIGPNIYEADRFATAAFAMGISGIVYLNSLPGFEAYLIDTNKIATYTEGFDEYVVKTN